MEEETIETEKMNKIYKVLCSCKSWEQLILSYRWICRIVKNKNVTDELFSYCITLNNKKGF